MSSLSLYKEKDSKKTLLAFFLTDCAWPIGFYLTYIHCSNILKNSFGYTPEKIINHNFFVAMVELFGAFLLIYLSRKIFPLKILKVRLAVFSVFVVICPYLFNNLSNPLHVFLIQALIMLFGCYINPAFPIFYKQLPILKRFTYSSLSFALSRAGMYVITSFGIIYILGYIGQWGLLIILVPSTIAFGFGVNYFNKLENDTVDYYQKAFDAHPEKM